MAFRTACISIGVLFFPVTLSAQGLTPSNDIPRLESAVRADSNDAQLHYQLAVAYWSRKRYDEAERSLRAAVSIERRFAGAYLALSYLPFARRKQLFKEEARRRVPPEWRDAVIEADRSRRLAFLINPLVDLQIMGAVIPTQESVLALRGGSVVLVLDPFSAFVRGDYRSAYAIFNSWVNDKHFQGSARDSMPETLLWFRGISAGHIAQYDTATSDFATLLARGLNAERASGALPLRTNDYRYILATLQYRAHRFPEAITLYKEALGNDLGLFMAHVQMGKIYEELKAWPDAIEHFRSAVATNPDDPSLLLDLGIILREAGNLAESETTLQEARQANRRDSRVPYHLGITLQEEGKKPQARDAFMEFLLLAPSRYERQLTEVRQRLIALQP